jgi:probable phosphoglycerate mutase
MAKSEVLNVVLVRTGASEWDRMGRLSGRADLPLCPSGGDELCRRVGEFDGTELSHVLHGPDQCSVGTAEALSRVTGAKTREVEGLAELDLGLWEGLRIEELEDKFPRTYREWLEDPSRVRVPEGEPLTEAVIRLASAIGRTCEKLRGTDPGVGVVLRPMAYGLVRCWIRGQGYAGMWPMASGPWFEWHELPRLRLREAKLGVGAAV